MNSLFVGMKSEDGKELIFKVTDTSEDSTPEEAPFGTSLENEGASVCFSFILHESCVSITLKPGNEAMVETSGESWAIGGDPIHIRLFVAKTHEEVESWLKKE